MYTLRKFRSQTSDNMDRWKAEQGRGREKRKIRREKSRRERVRRKKIQMREKVGKSRFTVFFQWFVAPEGRKVGSLKRRVRSQLARWEMKNCTPLWREAHFASQNVQNTSASDHFWKLRCRKSARRCGAKHISKSKCTKHTSVGPLLEVAMSKKCTPLWREAHFEVKMYKTHHFGPLLEVQMSKKCTPLWREAHFQVKMYKTTLAPQHVEKVHRCGANTQQNVQTLHSDHFWRLRLHSTTTTPTPQHSTSNTKLHSTTLHYLPLHFTTLHYTTLHYNYNYTTTLHYTPLH